MSNRALKIAAYLLLPVGVAAFELGLGVRLYSQPTWTTEQMALWAGAALFLNYVAVSAWVSNRLARR